MRATLTMALTALAGIVLLQAAIATLDYTPAKLRGGDVPPIPVQAIGGGEVILEVGVNAAGYPDKIKPLRVTPPFDQFLLKAVSGWTFDPAREGDQTVASTVLVAAMFRPPDLLNTPTLGDSPRTVASPGPGLPFPTATTLPLYPPLSSGAGVVLVDVTLTAAGRIDKTAILRSSPGFDGSALDAAAQWKFAPAHRSGTAVPAHAYLVFGFRQPIVSPTVAPHR